MPLVSLLFFFVAWKKSSTFHSYLKTLFFIFNTHFNTFCCYFKTCRKDKKYYIRLGRRLTRKVAVLSSRLSLSSFHIHNNYSWLLYWSNSGLTAQRSIRPKNCVVECLIVFPNDGCLQWGKYSGILRFSAFLTFSS